MDKESETTKKEIQQILSLKIRKCLAGIPINYKKLQEIRLRAGMPLMMVYEGKEYFMSLKGELTRNIQNAYIVTASEIKETMEYVSIYSRYAYEQEISQGFITVQGGHRVGVAGRIVWDGKKIKNINYISFLNIRLAHQIKGCADKVMPFIRDKSGFKHTLIISPPRCGKTTLLRDIIRMAADGDDKHAGMTVGVVDERSEIGACYMGRPQNDLGCRADVLDGCPKADGMMMLVRSMSPDVIAVDEIGSKEDIEAMEYVMNCGIKLIATVHGKDMDEIRNKPILGQMVRERMFQRYILLQAGSTGVIQSIFDERGSVLYTYSVTLNYQGQHTACYAM